jgi:integrase
MANRAVMVMSVLLQFSVEREYVSANVALRVKKLPIGRHERWPEGVVDWATTPGNLPEHLRRAIVLAVHTGQREGDCLAMRWSDYDGSGIQVRQEKTGEELWVPVHPTLKAELDAWRAGPMTATTILTRATGLPWVKGAGFATMVGRELARHDHTRGFVFHGLRCVAAARLAEAGCTVHEIAAITGHRTLQMLQHYTRQAEQRTRAVAAIVKLKEWKK